MRTRKLPETKLHSKNLIKGVNTWTVPLYKILLTILKVNERRTLTNGPENEKIMTLHKALHSRNDIDRMNVSRK